MISAVVVSHNEGHLLDACLKSILFCDEIIVVDLESTDNTKEIAEKYEAKYIYHQKVPVVEIIHTWIQDKTKYDWILITDPDEVCSNDLSKELLEILPSVPLDIGLIDVPWKFYFGNHLLKGTQWGGVQRRVFLVNKNRFIFTKEVHRGRHLKKGYKPYIVKNKGNNFVHHFWMQNLRQLTAKHKRYLNREAESRYNSGERSTIKQILKTPLNEFYSSFWIKNGFKDGFTGFFLSLFWAWYETKAKLKLYIYSNKIKQNNLMF
ncbi:glycosyltransferase [Urechidicola croceus]|uniref:Glycosyltransferase 2-like domain-containing protein n=1 Tax=Urechidicola croceus TaxID=1850246 RepID=A0A1D8P4I7_9FLAO|nr:glycosyltransferase [Urechidicola croceus]AOW19499.1 hypothetical protein LPB138_01855 [Urechidicola croceus]